MDDLMRGFGLFSGLAITALLFGLLPFLLLGLAIPYAILHSRDSRGVERDPQLGLKTALYFFYSVSILMVLMGLSIIVVDLLRDLQLFGPAPFGPRPRGGSSFNSTRRFGSSLMFAGFIFGLVQFIIIHMTTNDRRWPLPRRVFGGWRLAVSGLVVLLTFTGLVVSLFQENMQVESLQDFIAVLSVWSPAWLVDLVLLKSRSRQYVVEEEPPPRTRFPRREREREE
jgi:hypothetical protein